ncbi:hypothetical protein, partial [Treponema sp. R8-4-B8]
KEGDQTTSNRPVMINVAAAIASNKLKVVISIRRGVYAPLKIFSKGDKSGSGGFYNQTNQ